MGRGSIISKIKNHFEDHKEFYVGLGVGIAIAGTTYGIMRGVASQHISRELLVTGKKIVIRPLLKESRTVLVAGADTTDSFLFGQSIFGSVTNINNAVTTLHKGTKGHPGFVTKCVETGEFFATQGDAARAFSIPEEMLSKHLNYGRELSEGLHFERIGVLS